MEIKEEIKEEIWGLPCMNYIIYRNSSLPEGEYRWFQEITLYDNDRSRLMGRCWFDKEDKANYLFLGSWKVELEGRSKTDKEWENEINKYPKWNKSKYLVKRADFGGCILCSDGSGPIKNKEDEKAIEKSLNN